MSNGTVMLPVRIHAEYLESIIGQIAEEEREGKDIQDILSENPFFVHNCSLIPGGPKGFSILE